MIPAPALTSTQRAILAITLVFFALGLLHGIGDDWLWGHIGYNGAGFVNSARNGLRIGTLQPYHYFIGTGMPPATDIYVHHPLALHAHMLVVYALFGSAEWAARLVPVLYAFATIALLFSTIRRQWGVTEALVAAGLYATMPMHFVFGGLVCHEPGAVFWMLATTSATLRAYASADRRALAILAACLAMALNFSWPAYMLAAVLGVQAIVVFAFRRARNALQILGVLVASVIVWLSLFIAWAAWSRGGLGALRDVFFRRTGGVSGYVVTVWERLLDLHGPLVVALLMLWIALLFWRFLKGGLLVRDVLPIGFVVTQILHSVIFRQGGSIHSYWTFYLGVGAATAGAQVATGAGRWLAQRSEGVAIALVSSALSFQLLWSVSLARTGWETGGMTYYEPYRDAYDQTRLAKWLGRQYPRTTRYRWHASMLDARMEQEFYLDAVQFRVTDLAIGADEVLVVDLQSFAGKRADLASVARRHRTVIVDARFVIVEGGTRPTPIAGLRFVDEPASLLWRWFVNPRHPPFTIEPDPAPEWHLIVKPPPVASPIEGGGGWDVSTTCEGTATIDGVRVTTRGGKPAGVLSGLAATCDGAPAASWGRMTETDSPLLSCPAGTVLVGLHGRRGDVIDALGFLCDRRDLPHTDVISTEAKGGKGGVPFSMRCPPGTAVDGLRGRTAPHLTAIGIECR